MSETINQGRRPMSQMEKFEQLVKENLVNLLKYDGIIRETAISNLEEKYASEVIEVALKYSDDTSNILPVLSACDVAYRNADYYVDEFIDEDGEIIVENDGFTRWYLENIARLTNEECQSMLQEKAKEHEERERVNSLLRNYDNLQKKLLKLNLGYEGPSMTVEEIAKLPEFDGREDFIRLVMSGMGDTRDYSKRIIKKRNNEEANDNAKV